MRLPLVPVIVIGYVPGVVGADVNDRTEVPLPPVTTAGLKLPVNPAAALNVNETLPVKPASGTTLIV